jgi:nucleoid-associated protein YgaU
MTEAGWVRVPNKGRIPSDMDRDSVAFGEAGHRGLERTLDRRSHMDGGIHLESGSPATRPVDTDDRAMTDSTSPVADPVPLVRDVRPVGVSKTDPGSQRVEPSHHIVERGENFFTIAQLYYGSGPAYYLALWKYNAEKYPDIRTVHINDVILIPAVEDLDPAYIRQPHSSPARGRDESAVSTRNPAGELAGPGPSGSERPKSFPTTRTARTSDTTSAVATRRPVRVDRELELPVGDADPEIAHGGRETLADGSGEEDENGPAARSTARPRNLVSNDRPVYKVRRYDSLRSIARDILGDARRADEIYEINRDVIGDPTHLTPGQLLELPEDADTRRVTVRDRYRGSE